MRALTGAAGAVAAIVVIYSLTSAGGSSAPMPGESGTATTQPKLVAKLAPRPLPAPVSGEVVVPRAGKLLVIGGLDGAGASAGGIFSLDPRTGTLQSVGALAQPLHDAAGSPLGNSVLVFGGGTSTGTDAVESFTAGHDAQLIGHLPTARSDLVAVSLGGRAYVLGGYDGNTPSPAVLQTSDGRHFSSVTQLPVPVRYPAAAVSGQTIYVFGGETASGQPTDAIQQVDAATGAARVIGRLPNPLDHASAVGLGGRIYVLGGSVNGAASARVLAFDPSTGNASVSGRLPMPVSNAAAATVGDSGYLVGGVGAHGAPLASVISVSLKTVKAPASPPAAQSTTSSPPASPEATPFGGQLLIADRGNDRLLVVNAQKQVLWRYPGPGRPAPTGGFYFPDDAFFTHHGTGIVSNEEQNETIVQIGYPSGKVTWSYGHPGITGSTPGYLHEPDDAYLLKDGTITVADAQNCRILFISPQHRTISQLGTSGSCVHDPPRSLGSPNGDTPLANGDVLVSEVSGSYIDEFTPAGRLVWSRHLPIAYPSDPQQLGPNRYLVADYARPGGVFEFDRAGHILWSYSPTSGKAMLDHPSLAERLPNGLIAVTDDYRDRVVLIDPKTKRIVWQYGRTDTPGTGANQLNTPDGFDFLEPGGVTPTHPYTG
jgi:outer membrane protein assembly factor BamB